MSHLDQLSINLEEKVSVCHNIYEQCYYRVSQKNALSECCWSHSALAQSQVLASSPCVWKLIFWLFLTKTKPDQALPSYVCGKIHPHSFQFWL